MSIEPEQRPSFASPASTGPGPPRSCVNPRHALKRAAAFKCAREYPWSGANIVIDPFTETTIVTVRCTAIDTTIDRATMMMPGAAAEGIETTRRGGPIGVTRIEVAAGVATEVATEEEDEGPDSASQLDYFRFLTPKFFFRGQ